MAGTEDRAEPMSAEPLEPFDLCSWQLATLLGLPYKLFPGHKLTPKLGVNVQDTRRSPYLWLSYGLFLALCQPDQDLCDLFEQALQAVQDHDRPIIWKAYTQVFNARGECFGAVAWKL